MTNHIQNYDVQELYTGMNVPVYVNDTLASSGWRGGQWVIYTANTFGPANNVKNIRVVGSSDGTYTVGFLVRGSNFHPNAQSPGGFDLRTSEYNYSSYVPTDTRVVTMFWDGSFIFKMYEKYAFPNRDSGTALAYNLNEDVCVSDRGYITTYADAVASGIVTPFVIGCVWMIPSTDNFNTLGVDVRF